jgi:hypothetical protein
MNLREPEVLVAGMLTMAACLVVHAAFMFLVIRSHVVLRGRFPGIRGLPLIMPTILLATVLMAASSMLQVLIWFGVLHLFGTFPNVEDALYFSGTTYTTLGTARHYLMPPYRMLEPLEAMTGTLAAGLNTAVLFAILSNLAREHSALGSFFRSGHDS